LIFKRGRGLGLIRDSSNHQKTAKRGVNLACLGLFGSTGPDVGDCSVGMSRQKGQLVAKLHIRSAPVRQTVGSSTNILSTL